MEDESTCLISESAMWILMKIYGGNNQCKKLRNALFWAILRYVMAHKSEVVCNFAAEA